jgi:hypothetical protein
VEAAVHTWTTIVSLPLCAALTAAGLALSWLIWRRGRPRRGIRAAAWSLLPLALYLTGAVPMLWRVGSAIADFAQGFVFSPKTWAGLALFGVAALILLVSGGIPLLTSGRKRAKKRELKKAEQGSPAATKAGAAVAVPTRQGDRPAVEAGTPEPSKVRAGRRAKGGSDDDGLDPDVAAILRRRGIT